MKTETKTHWKKLDNPNYLGAYSLLGNCDEMTLTIDRVVVEEVKTERGADQCKVAHFKENVKPMILNTVNCKAIENQYDTPFIEDWAGKQICVFVKKIKAFGEQMDALRVRPPKKRPPINGTRFAQAIQAIQDKKFTKEKLQEQFTLTEEQINDLKEI